MELLSYLNDGNVANFLLLLLRFSGIIAFFPFFDSKLIPMSVKGAMIFFLALLFFKILPPFNTNISLVELMIAGTSEILFGFLAAFLLQIVFSAIIYAGELLGFSIGMSVSSTYDPVSGSQNLIIAQVLSLVAMLVFLSLDFHHLIFSFIANSLYNIPLGGFIFSQNLALYAIKAAGSIFIIGFTIAFPIVGIIILSEIIFGMITRTHPQFNLLIIGLPLKVIVAFIVFIIALPAMMFHFKSEIFQAFKIIAKMVGG
ncbi:flagellar biosynthetic protein FliR [Helicobacter sp. MIT 14-3879]|uniref:flagellar biosynthetic protein FliR n=1 Tax=Helicobacter sp. MIT 14-3879 TaxID=2040649 RepID=UPI000E1F9B9A|nr:flagellar biosynthetic protein FliR [Helicobacter sp. MIT 14-3879]RDU65090.1 flagellar type III secretion system protein FliR [Helicobacter sp. MIT 14-3879]